MIWEPDLTTESGMDADERAVFRALYPAHVGRAKAIDRDALAAEVRIPDRRLRTVLDILIEAHRIPIGSSTRPPYGYFIIDTPEEAAEVYRMLRAYGLSALARMAAVSRIVADTDRRRIQCELPLKAEVFRA